MNNEHNIMSGLHLLTAAEIVADTKSPQITASHFHKQQIQAQNMLKAFSNEQVIAMVELNNKLSDHDLNRIVCAANRHPDLAIPLLGPRHWSDAMRAQYDHIEGLMNSDSRFSGSMPPHHEFEEGFIDKFGNFKTRQEAWIIAEAAGQIIRRVGGDHRDGGTLYTENIY